MTYYRILAVFSPLALAACGQPEVIALTPPADLLRCADAPAVPELPPPGIERDRATLALWLAEREALIRSHQEHSDSLQSGWSEEREALDAQYQQAKEESDRAWAELHSEANRRADELAHEKDDLLRKYEELKAESQREKEIIKSVATNLESEKARLEKMMECYGDIAEIKSKGDTY